MDACGGGGVLDPKPARKRDRIALVGISGSGKSTVASVAAARLGWRAFDSDRVIEHRTGRTIPDLFANEGEAAFRELEAGAIAALPGEPRIILATGGGAPTTEAGRRALSTFLVIWLRISPEVAAARLMANPDTEKRPLLAGDTLARLRILAESRRHMYETSADVIIDVDGLTPSEVADAVAAACQEHQHQPTEAQTNP